MAQPRSSGSAARRASSTSVRAALGKCLHFGQGRGRRDLDRRASARSIGRRAAHCLRDQLEYQQLMEIAGVDYPERAERFEVVYHLLSVTQEPPPARPRLDRRGHAGADRDRRLAGRRLARARSVRHVRRALRRQSRPAPHPHRLRLSRPSAAQGFPAHRLCRAALFRGGEARRLRAGQPRAGFPQLRFHEPVGRRRIYPAGRREGACPRRPARRRR